jgi:hypothetical protein
MYPFILPEERVAPVTNGHVGGGLEESQDFRRCPDWQLAPCSVLVRLLKPQPPCLQSEPGIYVLGNAELKTSMFSAYMNKAAKDDIPNKALPTM